MLSAAHVDNALQIDININSVCTAGLSTTDLGSVRVAGFSTGDSGHFSRHSHVDRFIVTGD